MKSLKATMIIIIKTKQIGIKQEKTEKQVEMRRTNCNLEMRYLITRNKHKTVIAAGMIDGCK